RLSVIGGRFILPASSTSTLPCRLQQLRFVDRYSTTVQAVAVSHSKFSADQFLSASVRPAGAGSVLEAALAAQAADDPDHLAFLAANGEMAQRIRTHDWSATPLGPPASWPQSLRTALRILLTTRHPAHIFWGERLICFYNDAF